MMIPAPGNRPPTSGKKDTNPQAEDFARLSRALANDHAYTTSNESLDFAQGDNGDSASHKDTDDEEAPGPAKKARKEHPTESQPKLLTFDPTDIVHPNSTAWLPSQEVADYVQSHLRSSFDKDVRARQRSECPRLVLAAHVAEIPRGGPNDDHIFEKICKRPQKGH